MTAQLSPLEQAQAKAAAESAARRQAAEQTAEAASAVSAAPVRTLAVVAEELRQAANRLGELEQDRARAAQFGPDVELELTLSRWREHVKTLEDELDELRRADDDRRERERREAEEAKAAARPALFAERDRLTGEQQTAFRAIEAALDELVPAIEAAMTADVGLRAVAARLGESHSSRTLAVVENRIAYRLKPVGVKDLYVFGPMGAEPLAEPAAEPARTGGSRRGGGGKPKPATRSTGRAKT